MASAARPCAAACSSVIRERSAVRILASSSVTGTRTNLGAGSNFNSRMSSTSRTSDSGLNPADCPAGPSASVVDNCSESLRTEALRFSFSLRRSSTCSLKNSRFFFTSVRSSDSPAAPGVPSGADASDSIPDPNPEMPLRSAIFTPVKWRW